MLGCDVLPSDAILGRAKAYMRAAWQFAPHALAKHAWYNPSDYLHHAHTGLQELQAALELQNSMLALFKCSTFSKAGVPYDREKHAFCSGLDSAADNCTVSAVITPGLLVFGGVRTKAVVQVS